jgi:hypothetical protein
MVVELEHDAAMIADPARSTLPTARQRRRSRAAVEDRRLSPIRRRQGIGAASTYFSDLQVELEVLSMFVVGAGASSFTSCPGRSNRDIPMLVVAMTRPASAASSNSGERRRAAVVTSTSRSLPADTDW